MKIAKYILPLLLILVLATSLLVGCQPTTPEPEPDPDPVDTNFDEATGLNFELSENGLYYIVVASPECNLDLTIPAEFKEKPVREIAKGAFAGMSLTRVVLPDCLDVIGERAFYGCSSITDIVIPGSVDAIGDYAFSGCSALSAITFGSTIGSNYVCNVETIGEYAFSNCAFTTLTIPDCVTEIGANAFNSCWALKTLVIGNGVETIKQHTFENCNNLNYLTMGTGVKKIERDAFVASKNIFSIHIVDIASWCGIEGLEEIMNGWCVKAIYHNGEEITNLVIPEGVTEIKENAFYNCGYITWVTLSMSMEQIGENAFGKCYQLDGPTKNGLRYLGSIANDYLYLYCADFLDITDQAVIDKECKIASPHAFDGCDQLVTREYLGGRYIESEDNPYCYLVGAKNIYITGAEIHAWCEFMGAKAFSGCFYLASDITIPELITYIPSRAFQSCSVIPSITLHSGVTYIGESAFDGCSSLTEFTIPDGITEINQFAFSNCTSLASITIPASITTIGYNAFQGCKALTTINIPAAVTIIEERAFSNNTNLTTINFAGTSGEWESVSLGNYWFASSSVKVVCIDKEITINKQ